VNVPNLCNHGTIVDVLTSADEGNASIISQYMVRFGYKLTKVTKFLYLCLYIGVLEDEMSCCEEMRDEKRENLG